MVSKKQKIYLLDILFIFLKNKPISIIILFLSLFLFNFYFFTKTENLNLIIYSPKETVMYQMETLDNLQLNKKNNKNSWDELKILKSLSLIINEELEKQKIKYNLDIRSHERAAIKPSTLIYKINKNENISINKTKEIVNNSIIKVKKTLLDEINYLINNLKNDQKIYDRYKEKSLIFKSSGVIDPILLEYDLKMNSIKNLPKFLLTENSYDFINFEVLEGRTISFYALNLLALMSWVMGTVAIVKLRQIFI